MANVTLRREVRVGRSAVGAGALIALAVAIPLAWSVVLVCAPRREVVTIERTARVAVPQLVPVPQLVTVPQVLVLPMPIAAAPRPPVVATCPPPRGDAPRLTPGALPEAIDHVRPAPTNAGWIAAWNDAHVYVSTDAGATWHRQLDGDGTVDDVTFDCFGRTLVVRGDRIGIHDGHVEHWRTPSGVPLAAEVSLGLLGGGPELVVLATTYADETRSRLLRSADLGDTWQRHDLEQPWDTGRVVGRQYDDGVVRGMYAVSDCMSEAEILFELTAAGLRTAYANAGYRVQVFRDVIVGSTGWQRFGGEAHDFADDVRDVDVLAGPYPIARIDADAFRVRGSKLVPLPWKIAGERAIVDAAGRIWSVCRGAPRIATRALPDEPCDG